MTAFLVGLLATLHKVRRAGTIWSSQLARYPPDLLERILWFYSMPVLLLGMGMLAFLQYAPLLWT